MTLYLSNGWFDTTNSKSLHQDIIDGAIDLASLLFRADISADTLQTLALHVRTAITIADPQMEGIEQLSQQTVQSIRQKFEDACEYSPELYSFLIDCLDHIQTPKCLLGLYLHLIHVSRMLQLFSVASTQTSARSNNVTK